MTRTIWSSLPTRPPFAESRRASVAPHCAYAGVAGHMAAVPAVVAARKSGMQTWLTASHVTTKGINLGPLDLQGASTG